MKCRTGVFAMLMILLLLGAGYGQQSPANSPPDIPQAVAAKAQPPKVVYREAPVYPPEARARRLMGTVVVEGVVDRQGNVTGARMVNGLKIFEDAALRAIKAWKFSPATLDGQPVEQKVQIKLTFRDTTPADSAGAKP